MINFTGLSISNLESFNFSNLRELCLSNCSLKQYPTLKTSPNLLILDLSYNGIHELGDGPKATLNLKQLDLTGNFLVTQENLKGLWEFLRDLHVLDLRFNPITMRKGYRSMILLNFLLLTILDCQEVKSLERVILRKRLTF